MRSATFAEMLRVVFVVSFAFCGCVFAQGSSAMTALKLLPKDVAKRLARIEAREGAPWPERWYFLVHDSAAPLGLREYVVAEGAVKASRTLSQFADSLKAADVIGADVVKVDSTAVATLAGRFTAANGVRLGSVNYELGKYGEGGAPAWRATVLNDLGDPLGILIISAQKGAVERHDGFDKNPLDVPVVAAPVEAPKPKPAVVEQKPAVKPPQPPPQPVVASSPEALLNKPFLAEKPTPAPVRVAPKPTPTPPNALKRFGSSVKKLFGN